MHAYFLHYVINILQYTQANTCIHTHVFAFILYMTPFMYVHMHYSSNLLSMQLIQYMSYCNVNEDGILLILGFYILLYLKIHFGSFMFMNGSI
jgi:hypothetical protein